MERPGAHGWRTADLLVRISHTTLAVERELRTTFQRLDACILAARLLHDVFAADEIEVALLPCRVAVWNGVWIRYVAEHGAPPQTLAESERLAAAGGWCSAMGAGYIDARDVAFGFDRARRAYNGHLVAVVADRWLVDPTLGQVTDPQRAIAAGPLVTEICDAAFLRGEVALANLFAWGDAPPVHVTYEAVPDDLSFRDAPIWSAPEAVWLARRVRADVERAARALSGG